MVIPDSGEVARLVLGQAAHDYLHDSVVMPARELREELERFKRQKKDIVAPQDLVAGLDGENDGEEDADDNDEARLGTADHLARKRVRSSTRSSSKRK